MKLRHLAPIALVLAAAAAACSEGGRSPTTGTPKPSGPSANLTGAVFTTDGSCGGSDLNIYPDKDSVYANGGPQSDHAAGLPDGTYYVKVTSPDGVLLGTSVGSGDERPAHVTAGHFDQCYRLSDILIRASNGQPGYDDTPNAGGEYKLWISSDRTFAESETKTDNFKVQVPAPPVVMPEVTVTKTASTYYERVWQWSVDKNGDTGTLTLAPGQSKAVNYSVTVTNTGTADRRFAVSGTVTVANSGTVAATVNSVADVSDLGPADQVSCGTLPRTLAVGESMSCSYSEAVTSATFGTSYRNTATASVGSPVAGGTDLTFSGGADFSFDGANPNLRVDECVAVADSYAGSPVTGNVCAADSPKIYTYARTFGPGHLGDCGKTISYPNTARATGTETNASDAWNVDVSYICGCTPGYWKNNTGGWPVSTAGLESGPFPASMQNPPYVLSGKVLGNYTLLQGLGFQGNSTVEGGAEILLRAATAAYLNASKFGYALTVAQVTSRTNAALATLDRAQIVALATQLDAYNNAGCPLNARGAPINP